MSSEGLKYIVGQVLGLHVLLNIKTSVYLIYFSFLFSIKCAYRHFCLLWCQKQALFFFLTRSGTSRPSSARRFSQGTRVRCSASSTMTKSSLLARRTPPWGGSLQAPWNIIQYCHLYLVLVSSSCVHFVSSFWHFARLPIFVDPLCCRVWDVCSGEMVNTLIHHCEAVLHLRFTNGLMVTCSKDRSIAVWDLASPTDISLRRVLVGHRAAVNVVDFDDKYIVSASGDRTIKVCPCVRRSPCLFYLCWFLFVCLG